MTWKIVGAAEASVLYIYIYIQIRGKKSLNDFIFMSYFCVTKNNSNL